MPRPVKRSEVAQKHGVDEERILCGNCANLANRRKCGFWGFPVDPKKTYCILWRDKEEEVTE